MKIHLYMLCYRFEALVASHLDPEAFGHYMAVGTKKLTSDKLLFFEVTEPLPGSYFKLDDLEQRCVPHTDGSPKRSKYISVYRVLEHIPLASLGRLYLVTADGRVLGLDGAPYEAALEQPAVHLYQELSPLTPLVVSALSPKAFARFMTDPQNPVQAPRLFFADLLLDRDARGRLAGYLPYAEPMHVQECLNEVEQDSTKPTKTVARMPAMNAFFRTIRNGFFVGDPTGLKFYPFPNRDELETKHARWWSTASAC